MSALYYGAFKPGSKTPFFHSDQWGKVSQAALACPGATVRRCSPPPVKDSHVYEQPVKPDVRHDDPLEISDYALRKADEAYAGKYGYGISPKWQQQAISRVLYPSGLAPMIGPKTHEEAWADDHISTYVEAIQKYRYYVPQHKGDIGAN